MSTSGRFRQSVNRLTLRENTARPITIDLGTNLLIGSDYARLEKEVEMIVAGHSKAGRVPPLWDGHAAERVADALLELLRSRCS